jgi:hypothetical protein
MPCGWQEPLTRPRFPTTTHNALPALPTTHGERGQEFHRIAASLRPAPLRRRAAHPSPRAPDMGRASPTYPCHRGPRSRRDGRTALVDHLPHRARFDPTHPRTPGTAHAPAAHPPLPRRALRAQRSTTAERHEELDFSACSQARTLGLTCQLRGRGVRFRTSEVRPRGRAPHAAGSSSTSRRG